ncbi:hypothetical protein GCM10010909_34460 [Acidocella aquatica]|uniref:ABM domain-containing protein n=1 Tax=Acidocella aquatica TaxID=1922313 RepID=A0ABQ6A977_9PROT|nr:antibiotic biosynthesis monooxygenase [Acidocella aquatica]GLR68764.1 hypothetical protein GCM10010909_34460 [Acidocella aquatica]
MPQIEVYTKFKIHDGRLETFKNTVEQLAALGRNAGAGLLRYDWFLDDARGECIAMEVHADEAAMDAHNLNAEAGLMRLREFSYRAVEMLVDAAPDADLVPGGGTRLFRFAAGLGAGSAAARFSPAGGRGETKHIEIYTRFFINPGSFEAFRADAAALLQAVKDKDTGTVRYDWFYDAGESECLALDTYDDAAAMFAHMANCHDAHERLLANATMVTEFLGALPEEAMAAVSKYDPYILPFFAGLKPYSQGGFG